MTAIGAGRALSAWQPGHLISATAASCKCYLPSTHIRGNSHRLLGALQIQIFGPTSHSARSCPPFHSFSDFPLHDTISISRWVPHSDHLEPCSFEQFSPLNFATLTPAMQEEHRNV